MKNKVLISLVGLTLLGCASDFYYDNGKKIKVTEIEATKVQEKKASDSKLKYYKTSKGHTVGVKNDILVECHEKVDCRKVLSTYEIVSLNPLSETIFIIKIANNKNVFEFSQKLYEDENVKIAHPNFRKEKRRR